MRFRMICFMILLLHGDCFAQDGRNTAYPERYQLSLPDGWKRPKLLESLTTVLPLAVSELKDKMFCISCTAGYTVKLSIGSPEIVSETIQDQRDIKKTGCVPVLTNL